MVEYNGKEMRFSTVCRLSGISLEAGRNRHNVLGRPYILPKIFFTSKQEWAAWARMRKDGDKKRVSKAVNNDRSPGWAERKYFPNAGSGGFSKNESHGTGCHLAGHCDLGQLCGD